MIENTDELDERSALRLIEELELNQPGQITESRAEKEVALKLSLMLEPGNASNADSLSIGGVTSRISRSVVVGVFGHTLRVGDVYRVRFTDAAIQAPISFALCERCRLLDMDSYEGQFSLFTPLDLATALVRP